MRVDRVVYPHRTLLLGCSPRCCLLDFDTQGLLAAYVAKVALLRGHYVQVLLLQDRSVFSSAIGSCSLKTESHFLIYAQ